MQNNIKLTIQEMQEIAKSRDGLCLSTEYRNAVTKLLWQCSKGHTWEAIPHSVKRGSWCPACNSERLKRGTSSLSIENMQAVAAERGGKCLAKEYKNYRKRLIWECSDGHKFELSYTQIAQKNMWCPYCRVHTGEAITKNVIEQLFSARFPKARPAWLRINGSRHELDGYNKDLGIAFEYQGRQHFKIGSFSTRTHNDLLERQRIDAIKEHICKDNNVTLIAIREFRQGSTFNELVGTITEKLERQGIATPKSEVTAENVFSRSYRQEVEELVCRKNGNLISSVCIFATSKIEVECENGHRWWATPHKLKNGRWCPHCCKNKKLTLEHAHAIAAKFNGKCLSTEYLNANTKMEWECEKGHRWFQRLGNIRAGHWCPTCGQKASGDNLRRFHKEKKSKILEVIKPQF